MSACNHYRQHLAMISVGALNESESANALYHVEVCSECRAYSERLRLVVRLYEEDAGRRIERTARPLIVFSAPTPALLSWRYAAALAAAACVVIVMVFTGRENSQPPVVQSSVVSQPRAGSMVSIANSRPLLDKDLEALLQSSAGHRRPDYVFHVGSRDEEP